ncbi:MAG: hypothetical protein ATN36_01690 [Epulopiscium sp. Nele67-Bin005]|nr:MAG: hypothetical protein ATN36_01690 [Epulopiscium sp. Nele67-Bin005]
MLKWKKKYEVGIPIIDEQHKQLFKIIDRAYKLLRRHSTDKYDETLEILDELVAYSKMHFETEERIMKENNYPNFKEHKASHDKFLMEVEEIITKAIHDVDDNMLRKILNILVEWLIGHIYGNDKDMGITIRNMNKNL